MLDRMKQKDPFRYVFHFLGFAGVFVLIVGIALVTIHVASAGSIDGLLPQ